MKSKARSVRQGEMRLSLGEVATVRGGYVGLDSSAATDEFRALQSADIAANGDIPWGALRETRLGPGAHRYRITEGDVLFPLRSVRPRATVARQTPANVVAIGQLAIVRPDRAIADAEYLVWYLNHPVTAARVARLAQGSKLSFLSLVAIREFEVEVPSLDVQRQLAGIAALHARVTELEQQLAQARTQFVDSVTMDALRRVLSQ